LQMSPMAHQSASKVRASALRRCAFQMIAVELLSWRRPVQWNYDRANKQAETGTGRRAASRSSEIRAHDAVKSVITIPQNKQLQTLRGIFAVVSGQIVEDHDIASRQGRRQLRM